MEFLGRFSKSQISNFTKIRPPGAALIHVDWLTDWTQLTDALLNLRESVWRRNVFWRFQNVSKTEFIFSKPSSTVSSCPSSASYHTKGGKITEKKIVEEKTACYIGTAYTTIRMLLPLLFVRPSLRRAQISAQTDACSMAPTERSSYLDR